MKKLFLTSLMCMFLGTAVAQQSPRKNKNARSTSDTISNNRDRSETQRNSASYKRDTINDHKNKTNRSGSDNSTMDRRRDSVSTSPTP